MSANGYKLVVNKGSNTFVFTAAWAAPFFSLLDNEWEEGDRPLLYHAESLEDARRFGGKILNADFTEYVESAELRRAA